MKKKPTANERKRMSTIEIKEQMKIKKKKLHNYTNEEGLIK